MCRDAHDEGWTRPARNTFSRQRNQARRSPRMILPPMEGALGGVIAG